ncbi:MAG: thiol:disulfide interchange protein DsbA/DsbL [Gammaproteobacteria bacterium]|nr:thiol:disulfide interchange protein DsbA/DsbL [Gammaproteobacteria bacterium]
MIKKSISGLLIGLIFSTQLLAQQAFVEGVDYQLINPPVNTSSPDKVVVTEMFWYGCPHCFSFEPFVQNWSANLSQGIIFEQVPSVLNPRWGDHARTYYSLKQMGELEKVHSKLFDAIHVERQRLNRFDDIAKFVATLGVNEAKFREVYNSFPVDALFRKNSKIEQKYGHRGVPSLIVNGKYLTSAGMAGSNQRLIQVIDFLANKELNQ